MIERGIDRAGVQGLFPPGGARNALDCALWELEAQRAGRPVWALAGVPAPKPLVTTFTLGAEAPEVMAAGARRYVAGAGAQSEADGGLRARRRRGWLRCARRAPRSGSGWTPTRGTSVEALPRLIRMLREAGVALIEQPVARGHEAGLEEYRLADPDRRRRERARS